MKTITHDVYCKLREQLTEGTLAPGARLSELALSEQFGTSRTPVREAIKELASEGLIEQIPNSGSFVRSVDRADLVGLFHLREWIECGAVALAVEWVDESQLAILESSCRDFEALANEYRNSELTIYHDGMWERRERIESDFHLTLLRAAANPMALQIIRNQRMLTRTWQVAPRQQRWQDVFQYAEEHRQVLEAIRRGEPETAAEALRRHIRGGREATLAAFDRNQQKLVMQHRFDSPTEFDASAAMNRTQPRRRGRINSRAPSREIGTE